MRKINRQDVLKIVLVLALVGGVGMSMAAVGRFTPTHAIVEPVYCGSCHPDQVRELNATTHLPHFMGAIYEEAEAAAKPRTSSITLAESVSGGCMMCHNTWNNRDKIFVKGYEIVENVSGTGEYQLKLNDVGFGNENTNTLYDVAVVVPAGSSIQTIRLGSNVNNIKVTVQDPGTSTVYKAGASVKQSGNYTLNGTTGIDLLISGPVIAELNATGGALKIVSNVNNGQTVDFKTLWGDLSAMSPTPGVFYNDQSGKNTCGNSEKGACHIVEVATGLNMVNKMAENKQGVSGSGTYFQHDMAYTSAEYAAKQVKLCGACHINKLPPMDANGEPIRQDITDTPKVWRSSHGTIYETEITTISSDWAHKGVQCIRCHGHAGIGPSDGLTGVRSN